MTNTVWTIVKQNIILFKLIVGQESNKNVVSWQHHASYSQILVTQTKGEEVTDDWVVRYHII